MPFKKSTIEIKKLKKLTFPIGVAIAMVIISINYLNETITTNIESDINIKNTIILDAGHGGMDGGAVGINDAIEKDINLSIALTLKDMLLINGFDVVMTREEDISLNDAGLTKISEIKTSDIKNRLKLVEEYPNATVIMIHQNHFTEEKYNGAQMFYGHLNNQSEILAQNLQTSIRSFLQPGNTREIKESTSAVYLLHNSSNPIVLAECGFLSNYKEAELLITEEYQQKMAFALLAGIVNYLES